MNTKLWAQTRCQRSTLRLEVWSVRWTLRSTPETSCAERSPRSKPSTGLSNGAGLPPHHRRHHQSFSVSGSGAEFSHHHHHQMKKKKNPTTTRRRRRRSYHSSFVTIYEMLVPPREGTWNHNLILFLLWRTRPNGRNPIIIQRIHCAKIPDQVVVAKCIVNVNECKM